MNSAELDARLLADLKNELRDGETIVWSGRPDWRVTLRRMRFLTFIAIPWLAASFLLPLGEAVRFFAVIAGFGFLVGPAAGAFQTHRTIYALTNRRALALAKFARNRTFVAVDLGEDERQVEVLTISGKAGAVLFVPGLPRRVRYTDHTGKFGFWDLADAPALAATITKLLGERKRALN